MQRSGGAAAGGGPLQEQALDLLGELLSNWSALFLQSRRFSSLLPLVVSAATPLLRALPHDFTCISSKHGGPHSGGLAMSAMQAAAAMAHCGRVLRIARFLLLRGIFLEDLLGPLEGLLCAVVHCLQPADKDRDRERRYACDCDIVSVR